MSAVLVTGGAGYVGSHAVKALVAGGRDVVVFDDLSAGHAEAVERIGAAFPAQSVRLVEGDIADREALAKALRESGATAVMHFAARLLVAESVREPLGYYRANVTGTLAVLEAMAETGVGHFVFSSTAATFGEPSSIPIDEIPSPAADQCLWRDEAGRRAGLAARGAGHRDPVRDPAVFQRGGRRPGWARGRGPRAGGAPDPAGPRARSMAARRSPCSARTTTRRMARASATTCMCRIWPTRICSRSGGSRPAEPLRPTISAAVTACRCGRSSRRWRRSPAVPCRTRLDPGGRAIPPASWHRTRARGRSSGGRRFAAASGPSSRRRGAGMNGTPRGTVLGHCRGESQCRA